MSDIPEQEQEPVEPLASPKQNWWLTRQVWKHQWLGQAALAQGLVLLALFWLAPWFSWHVPVRIPLGIPVTPVLEQYFHALAADHRYSGWAVAQGVSIVRISFVPLVSLWLIPFAALALLVLAALNLRHALTNCRMSAALLALSTLALLVQLCFFIQAHAFQPSTLGAQVVAGVSWGFWGAGGVNVAALAVAILWFWLARPHQGDHTGRLAAPTEP